MLPNLIQFTLHCAVFRLRMILIPWQQVDICTKCLVYLRSRWCLRLYGSCSKRNCTQISKLKVSKRNTFESLIELSGGSRVSRRRRQPCQWLPTPDVATFHEMCMAKRDPWEEASASWPPGSANRSTVFVVTQELKCEWIIFKIKFSECYSASWFQFQLSQTVTSKIYKNII